MKIVLGSAAGLDALTHGFNSGFCDYKYGMTFSPERMEHYLAQSSMDPADCAVLLDENGAGQGVALLAIHGHSGWCGGLAVAPPLRRRGWALALMQAIHQRAVDRGVQQIQLEVLVENRAAQALYTSLGYRKERQLYIWHGVANIQQSAPPHMRLNPADGVHIVREMHGWHSERPYWGRTAPVLMKHLADSQAPPIHAYVAQDEAQTPLAFVLCRVSASETSDTNHRIRILDMAVRPDLPNAPAVMQNTLKALQSAHPGAALSILNEPEESPWNPVLDAAGLQCIERQYEMRLELA